MADTQNPEETSTIAGKLPDMTQNSEKLQCSMNLASVIQILTV
jgi:hypothetical protein